MACEGVREVRRRCDYCSLFSELFGPAIVGPVFSSSSLLLKIDTRSKDCGSWCDGRTETPGLEEAMGACSSSSAPKSKEEEDALQLYKATRARQEKEADSDAERAARNSKLEREVSSMTSCPRPSPHRTPLTQPTHPLNPPTRQGPRPSPHRTPLTQPIHPPTQPTHSTRPTWPQ